MGNQRSSVKDYQQKLEDQRVMMEGVQRDIGYIKEGLKKNDQQHEAIIATSKETKQEILQAIKEQGLENEKKFACKSIELMVAQQTAVIKNQEKKINKIKWTIAKWTGAGTLAVFVIIYIIIPALKN